MFGVQTALPGSVKQSLRKTQAAQPKEEASNTILPFLWQLLQSFNKVSVVFVWFLFFKFSWFVALFSGVGSNHCYFVGLERQMWWCLTIIRLRIWTAPI